ncbi:MAG: cell division topological specificity factor MinE [Symbiobacteriaceae bacterium]|nr:MAG: cell division topological specificity factor MinE [Bacillota bacterium]
MIQLLARLLGRDPVPAKGAGASKDIARERLRLMLVHDRADVDPQLLEALKNDLIQTISNYLEVDREGLEVTLHREEGTVALVASIPVRSVRRGVRPVTT